MNLQTLFVLLVPSVFLMESSDKYVALWYNLPHPYPQNKQSNKKKQQKVIKFVLHQKKKKSPLFSRVLDLFLQHSVRRFPFETTGVIPCWPLERRRDFIQLFPSFIYSLWSQIKQILNTIFYSFLQVCTGLAIQ